MHVKMRHSCTGKHFRVTFFAGESRDHTLANLGELCMTVGEWQKICGYMINGFKQGEEQSLGYPFTYESVGEEEALKVHEESKHG